MRYDIYISDKAKKKVLQLPIIPETMPALTRSSNNEEFDTFSNGKYNIIGDVGLLQFSLESWLPGVGKNYPFQRVKNINPTAYINLIETAMKTKQPIRVVIARNDGTYVTNDTYSVESFEWNEDRLGNYQYKADFKQWRDYNV